MSRNRKLWSQWGGPSGLGFGSTEGVSYLSFCIFVGRGSRNLNVDSFGDTCTHLMLAPKPCSKWQICTKCAKNKALATLWSRNVLPSCDVNLYLKQCQNWFAVHSPVELSGLIWGSSLPFPFIAPGKPHQGWKSLLSCFKLIRDQALFLPFLICPYGTKHYFEQKIIGENTGPWQILHLSDTGP